METPGVKVKSWKVPESVAAIQVPRTVPAWGSSTVAAMDSGAFHDFTFTPGVSMIVSCRDQEEIDRYWAGLSAVPEAERCGWCIDRWGVSWQIVPHNIAELMANAATRDKILHMGKIDLTKL